MADDTLTQEEMRRRNREYQREYYQQRKAEKMERWRARVAADPEAWRKKNREGMARFRAKQRDLNPPPPEPTPLDRFEKNVKISDNGCWLWQGTVTVKGYPKMRIKQAITPMHRWAYEHFISPIPKGFTIDHICHNKDISCAGGNTCLHRRCVNPLHLEVCSSEENTRRGKARYWMNGQRMRPTHCPHGHEYTPENTIPSGKEGKYRICRTCKQGHAAVQLELEKLNSI